ncbi:hypothetical protein GNP94_21285 [Paenibacillus campinasensis]|uniref:Peptidase M56 domain-containing protein n=1 Tax=Paenibacillus campinasensis TaxID=66347 RepID=A0ABW9T6J9_9BACL|nr:M56 family metallopeptidase [Paenibacillus campinasensis]MUG68512.1 hypothetical protein [Paenibacillus campinasensis]
MSVLFSLLMSTFVGSVLWIILSSIRPVTQKMFSQTWHYYTCLIPVFFFLGGTEMMNRIIPYVRSVFSNSSLFRTTVTDIELLPYIPPEPTTANISSLMRPFVGSLLQLEHMASVVMAIWIAGIVAFLAVGIRRYWVFKRSILQGSREWKSTKDAAVRVIISPQATAPMVMGFMKPMVVLPDARFEDKELSMILAHELMHVKRRDLLVKLAVLLANAIHWFNPAVYSLNKQIHIDCELSCDEKVVQAMDTEDRRLYGQTLLSMLEYGVMQKNVVGVSHLSSPKQEMKRRLGNLMSVKKTKKSMVVLSLVASITLVSGGGFAANVAEAAVSAASINDLRDGGSNVTLIRDDGTTLSFDKHGNVVPVAPRDKPRELTTDEVVERIRLHIEKGIAVPEGYVTYLKNKGKIDTLSTLFEGMSKIDIFTQDGIISHPKNDLLNP